jgi:O-antigen ligase
MNNASRKFEEAGAGVSSPRARARGRDFLYFALVCLLGALAITYPRSALITFAVALALGLTWWITVRLRRMGLEIWQALLLFTLSGYMLLNYGFENITIHAGRIPVIVSYALMYICLALAIYSSRRWIARVSTEPAMLCLFALILLSAFHLLLDVPAYGLWAIRDSTMILDGVFFILGMLWPTRANSVAVLIKWLMVITVINMFYALTFPWSAKVLSWSPASGVFMTVPIVGQYHGTDTYLLLGAVFCLGLGGYLIKRRRWILLLLVVGQLLALTILQNRAGYVALAAFIVALTLVGETRKSGILTGLLISALVVLVLATSVGGLELSGRIGPVNIGFLADHLRSITGEKVTAASSVQSRFDWTGEAMDHFRSSPVLGVGFGQALINYIDDETGAVVRFPHNSNISILARLGVIGFAFWAIFHFCLMRRFFYAYSHRKSSNKQVYELVLWIFMFYITFMISALVEAPFEFPSGAIPFYFFMGLGLGLIRWYLPEESKEAQRLRSAGETLVMLDRRHPSSGHYAI